MSDDREVLEIMTYKDYKVNDSHAAALEWLKKQEGVISIYHGVQIEDSTVGYVILHWKSLQHHMNLINSADFSWLVGVVHEFSSAFDLKHFHGKAGVPIKSLEAPVTEIVVFKLKLKGNREVLESTMDSFIKEWLLQWALSASFDRTVEDENQYFDICGWVAKEEHDAHPPPEKFIPGVLENATVDIKHTKLSKV